MNMESIDNKQKHFVLVHGACHGAWSWYKLKPRLESAGHWVTVLDLTGCGTDTKTIYDIHEFYEYTKPLMELMAGLGPQEKVVLVGHSLGGLNLALAMEKFPEKVAVAIFLTAFMPDTVHKPSYVLEQYCELAPKEAWLDTKFLSYGSPNRPSTSMFFGPLFLSSKLYSLSSPEDLELAKILTRPGSLFMEDLSKLGSFSSEKYGSVTRIYVICKQDQAIKEDFQRWMIQNNGGTKEVFEINGADHMPMLSVTKELFECLLKIALQYA